MGGEFTRSMMSYTKGQLAARLKISGYTIKGNVKQALAKY